MVAFMVYILVLGIALLLKMCSLFIEKKEPSDKNRKKKKKH